MSTIRLRRATAAGLVVLGLVLAASVVAGGPARADPAAVDPATRAAIQDVIGRQIAAFARDDAAEAESFAAPRLRERFPDPAQFLAMVKQNYAALVRPRATRFAEADVSPNGPVQTVTVIAADGAAWTAVYSFERSGADWRISGCVLTRPAGLDI